MASTFKMKTFARENVSDRRVWIVLNLATLIFLIQVLRVIDIGIEKLKYCEYIAALLIAYFASKNAYAQKNIRGCFVLVVLLFCILTARGVLIGNGWKQLGMDIITFSSLFALFAVRDERDFDTFIALFPKHIILWITIGLSISWFMISKHGISSATEDSRFVADDMEFYYSSAFGAGSLGHMLQPAILLVPFAKRLSNRNYCLWMLGILTYNLYGIWTTSREGMIVGLFSLAIGLSGIRSRDRFRLFVLAILVAVVLFGMSICISPSSSLRVSIHLTVGRFCHEPDYIEGRTLEAKALLGEFTHTEWILGRGFGGVQRIWIWFFSETGIGSMHYGWAHLILKGGLVGLVLFYGIIIYCLLLLWQKKGWYRIVVVFLCLYIAQDMWAHNQWRNLTRTIIAMIYAGLAFTTKEPQNLRLMRI